MLATVSEKLVDILKDLSGRMKVPILTPEYEVMLPLVDFPDLSTSDLYSYFSFSRASFFLTLERLRNDSVIRCRDSETDRRTRRYFLGPLASSSIVKNFIEYSLDERLREQLVRASDHEPKDAKELQKVLRVGAPTLDCRIVLYLSEHPDTPSTLLRSAVRGPGTTFNARLRELIGLDVLRWRGDGKDDRKKLYSLTRNSECVVEDVGRRVNAWIGSNIDRFCANAGRAA